MNQEVYFENIRPQIIKNLKQCQTNLKIAVAWFTDMRIIDVVNELINRNIDVEIIIYDNHINKKDLFEKLYYNEAKIFLSKKLMHNKFCIIDKKTVINGSYNWTNNASFNEENIQIVYNNYEFSQKFVNQFVKLKNSCKKIDDYFEYSIANLNTIIEEFEDYLSTQKQKVFPYFYGISESNEFTINQKTIYYDEITGLDRIKYSQRINLKSGFYLIKNEKEEKELLRAEYFLKSKYSIEKIYSILNLTCVLPMFFENIYGLSNLQNKVHKLDKEKYKVEEKKRSEHVFIDEKNIERDCVLTKSRPFIYRIGGQDNLYSIPLGYFRNYIQQYRDQHRLKVKIENRDNYDLFFINGKGEKISETLNFTHKLNQGLYYDDKSKSIIDINLKVFPLNLNNIKYVEEVDLELAQRNRIALQRGKN